MKKSDSKLQNTDLKKIMRFKISEHKEEIQIFPPLFCFTICIRHMINKRIGEFILIFFAHIFYNFNTVLHVTFCQLPPEPVTYIHCIIVLHTSGCEMLK